MIANASYVNQISLFVQSTFPLAELDCKIASTIHYYCPSWCSDVHFNSLGWPRKWWPTIILSPYTRSTLSKHINTYRILYIRFMQVIITCSVSHGKIDITTICVSQCIAAHIISIWNACRPGQWLIPSPLVCLNAAEPADLCCKLTDCIHTPTWRYVHNAYINSVKIWEVLSLWQAYNYRPTNFALNKSTITIYWNCC